MNRLVLLFLAACSGSKDPAVHADIRDARGNVVGDITWDAEQKLAEWTVHGTSGTTHLERLDDASARVVLENLVRVREHAPIDPPKAGYVTCDEANYCDSFEAYGGSCYACVDLRSDCSSTLTWSCTFQ